MTESGGEQTISFQKLVKHVKLNVETWMRREYDCLYDFVEGDDDGDDGGDEDDGGGGHSHDDGGEFAERVPGTTPTRARQNSMSIEWSPSPKRSRRLGRIPEEREALAQQGHATPRRASVVPETETTVAPPSRSSGRRTRPPNMFRDTLY